ncbi:50S ribosomal protein L7/L12 [Romboutsia lituseburensis]|uniref:50S ribosomal protein L7/L12 n=1 Tax=Romboutsia lituseburensis TaxID=1537 RepID=UPI0022EA85B5|nr:50S ribosomal protein L7/L12 [Romboutsia lituseburensis]
MNFFEVIVIGLMLSTVSYILEVKSSIDILNKKLDKISEKVGISNELEEDLKNELIDLISKGNKIKAIKKYRDNTGAKLKEAKDYIESLE